MASRSERAAALDHIVGANAIFVEVIGTERANERSVVERNALDEDPQFDGHIVRDSAELEPDFDLAASIGIHLGLAPVGAVVAVALTVIFIGSEVTGLPLSSLTVSFTEYSPAFVCTIVRFD